MESRQGRSIEVDFFRGVVLIVIVLDHIPGSALSHVMSRRLRRIWPCARTVA